MNARRKTGLLTAIAGGAFVISGLLGGTASAGARPATKPNPDHKVTICHAVSGLGETKNGYNIITVDVASIFTKGHDQHVHKGRSDIIPAFTYTDVNDVEHTYPGKGDASWIATGCAPPEETTPETTPDTTPEETTPDTTLVGSEGPTTTAADSGGGELPSTGSNESLALMLGLVLLGLGGVLTTVSRRSVAD